VVEADQEVLVQSKDDARLRGVPSDVEKGFNAASQEVVEVNDVRTQ
jgi:hypothetical protein